MRRRCFAALVTVGVASVLVLPSAALATSGNRVRIKAPKHVKLNVTFTAIFSGHSQGAKTVASFVNTGAACGSSYKRELASTFGTTQSVGTANGKFSFKEKFVDHYTGRHYICVYLITANQTTVAHAFHKYNVRS